MHQKRKRMVSLLLSLSMLCGPLPVLAADTEMDVTVQETTIVKPEEPENIAAEALADGSVRVTWSGISGVSGYRIYRKDGDEWVLLHIVKDSSVTSYTDKRVALNTQYTYTVCAYNSGDGKVLLGDYNTEGVTATTASALTEPQLGAVASEAYNSLTVTWYPSGWAEGYDIYRKTSASDSWVKLSSVSGLYNTSYTDTTVTCGTTYYYTVRAYGSVDGNQIYSSYDQTGISGTAVPAQPSLVSVSMDNNGLVVKWNKASGADSYRIYRKTDGTSWNQIASVSSGTTSYADSTVSDGVKYSYTVAGCASSAVGPYNTTGLSGTYYSYVAALNKGTLPTNIALPNVKKEQYGTSAEGRPLCAYTVGTGSKHMVLNFAIHGWEDNWSADGYELVRVAVKVLEKLSANASTVTSRGWSVTVIPYANPDGIVSGTTNNGPGRCTTYRYTTSGSLVKGGVDMNRCFPSGFSVYTNERNYTGPEALLAKEARALKTLIDNKKGSSTNVFIDIHGWTQQILTNSSGSGFIYTTLHSYFPNNSAGGLGGGYVSRYAKSLGYNACLFEFPRNVTSHSAMVNAGYDTKFVNAVMSMINNY